jgi:hypothetical protein
MSTHVTLKVIGSPSPSLQQMIRVHSGPTVNCAREQWACGQCASYASSNNIYRVISKDCGEHACLIPAADAEPPAPAPAPSPKRRRPRRTTAARVLPVQAPTLDLPKRDLARVCEVSVRYPTAIAAAGKAPKGMAIAHCSRCGGFHLTPIKRGSK